MSKILVIFGGLHDGILQIGRGIEGNNPKNLRELSR